MRKLWTLLALGLLAPLAQAAQQSVVVGTSPNDGTGDPIRTAFTKLNANDAELYAKFPSNWLTGTCTVSVPLRGDGSCGTIPAAAITGLAASATTDTTSATNISAGTLGSARLPTFSGDCTTPGASAVLTCTKTSGVSFAASATTDTTSATNISSGSLNSARLPTSYTAGSALAGTELISIVQGGAVRSTTPSAINTYIQAQATPIPGLPAATSVGATDLAPFYIQADSATEKVTGAQISTYVRSTVTKTDVGLSNVANVDTTNASNISSGTLATARGGFVATDLQTFSGSGTWNKPAGSPVVTHLLCTGGGGGGGGGSNVASGTAMSGGGGGGGGGILEEWIATSALGGTETVTIGTAGTAGTAGSGGAGGGGGNGGTTTFGAWVSAAGGGGGQGGQSAAASTGGGGGSINVGSAGSGGGAAGTPAGGGGGNGAVGSNSTMGGAGGGGGTNGGTGNAGGITLKGPTGGGAGAGLASSPASLTGGSSGKNQANAVASGGAANTGGGAGNLSANVFTGGSGGGGGGSSTAATAGTGGAGARGGGGGGGGAALTTTATSAPGGVGGAGYCVAETYF